MCVSSARAVSHGLLYVATWSTEQNDKACMGEACVLIMFLLMQGIVPLYVFFTVQCHRCLIPLGNAECPFVPFVLMQTNISILIKDLPYFL